MSDRLDTLKRFVEENKKVLKAFTDPRSVEKHKWYIKNTISNMKGDMLRDIDSLLQDKRVTLMRQYNNHNDSLRREISELESERKEIYNFKFNDGAIMKDNNAKVKSYLAQEFRDLKARLSKKKFNDEATFYRHNGYRIQITEINNYIEYIVFDPKGAYRALKSQSGFKSTKEALKAAEKYIDSLPYRDSKPKSQRDVWLIGLSSIKDSLKKFKDATPQIPEGSAAAKFCREAIQKAKRSGKTGDALVTEAYKILMNEYPTLHPAARNYISEHINDADWSEGKHKRDKDGKFSSTGNGGKSAEESNAGSEKPDIKSLAKSKNKKEVKKVAKAYWTYFLNGVDDLVDWAGEDEDLRYYAEDGDIEGMAEIMANSEGGRETAIEALGEMEEDELSGVSEHINDATIKDTISNELKKKIIAAVKSGKHPREVAKEFGRYSNDYDEILKIANIANANRLGMGLNDSAEYINDRKIDIKKDGKLIDIVNAETLDEAVRIYERQHPELKGQIDAYFSDKKVKDADIRDSLSEKAKQLISKAVAEARFDYKTAMDFAIADLKAEKEWAWTSHAEVSQMVQRLIKNRLDF